MGKSKGKNSAFGLTRSGLGDSGNQRLLALLQAHDALALISNHAQQPLDVGVQHLRKLVQAILDAIDPVAELIHSAMIQQNTRKNQQRWDGQR